MGLRDTAHDLLGASRICHDSDIERTGQEHSHP
jgi:hypothetical protein